MRRFVFVVAATTKSQYPKGTQKHVPATAHDMVWEYKNLPNKYVPKKIAISIKTHTNCAHRFLLRQLTPTIIVV